MNLHDKFIELENTFNDQKNTADMLFNLLPTDLKRANISRDALGDRYLYSFGNPLIIDTSAVHCFGGNQNHEIKTLYLALRSAYKYLDNNKLNEFIDKINNIDKHQEYLFEMRPLLNLRVDLKPQYESQNNCRGNKNIDWEIQGGDFTILFDVKNRVKSLIQHLSSLLEMADKVKAGFAPKTISPPNAPSPADLFKSVVEKFNDRVSDKVLQGAWIATGIMEDEKELNEYFNNLDSKKIQFAIISGWEKESYILTKNHADKQVLKNYFNLTESDGFTCSNYHNKNNKEFWALGIHP